MRIVGFDDGHQQRRFDGINHAQRIITLTFNGRGVEEINAICDFLDTQQNKVTSFDFTGLDGSVIRVVVDLDNGYSLTDHNTVDDVSVTFSKVFTWASAFHKHR
ncbi:TPA: phage tail protein [Klebsiella oxytoca]|nr:phage tail protein [Klebsiella oxytoca]HBC7498382.1 phage tail protein [Klebsiella oxytoca]